VSTTMPEDTDLQEVIGLIQVGNDALRNKKVAKFWTLYRLCYWYAYAASPAEHDMSIEECLQWATNHPDLCHFDSDNQLRHS
jgi:hypothetical protein